MSYFQNVINAQFRGTWMLGDQKTALDFNINPNRNTSDTMVSWVDDPYDFTTYGGSFTLNYAWDTEYKNYSALVIDVTGADPAATTAIEVAAALNANSTFSSMWVASTFKPYAASNFSRVMIQKKTNRIKQSIRVYISNTGAETALKFNLKAPVGEIPLYFDRHTIENRFTFPDSVAMLVYLDPSDPIDAAIITEAGFDPLVVKEDWELLQGRSGSFIFYKNTLDSSVRIVETIKYTAGSGVGDLAKKIQYSYTGANTTPDQITEIPYVLTSGDLITP